MNYSIIGTENLPNTYVEKVIIDKLSDSLIKNLKIDFDVCVYDAISPVTRKSYFNNSSRTSKNYLMVVISNSYDFTSEILKGVKQFDETYLRSLKTYSSDLVTMFTLRPKSKNRLNNKKETKINYNFKEYTLRKPTGHIAIFTCVVSFSKKYGRWSNGPVSCEHVMQENDIIKNHFYYTIENTKNIWFGPVHQHSSGVYMAGSFHNNNPHPKLKQNKIVNLKLIDNRYDKATSFDSQQRIEKPEKQRQLKNYLFSDIKFSQNLNNGIDFNFSFNTREYCKDYLLTSIPENKKNKIIDEIISNLKIKNLEIYYKESQNSGYKLAVKSMQRDNILLEEQSKFGSIREVILNEDTEFKTYFGSINVKQIHSIKVSVTVNNFLIEYYKKQYNKFSNSLTKLQEYLTQMQRGPHYDMIEKKTKQPFIDSFFNKKDFWVEPVKNYKTMLSIVTNKTPKLINPEIEKILSSINPRSTNKKLLSDFIESYKKYLKIYKNKFNINKKNSFSNNKRKQSIRNKVSVSKDYKINFKHLKNNISFFNKNQSKEMTVKSFMNLIRQDESRYGLSIEQTDSQILSLGPILVNIDDISFSLTDPNNLSIDIDKFLTNRKLLDISKDYRVSVKIIKDKEENTIEPTNIIGKDSSFMQNLDTRDIVLPTVARTVSFRKNKNMDSYLKNNKKLTKEKSFLKNRKPEFINNTPRHLRDLTNKDKIMEKDKEKFFEEDNTLNSLLYSNLASVYYYLPISYDNKGRALMNSNKFAPLTQKVLDNLQDPIHCFIQRNNPHLLDDSFNSFRDFAIIDSVFVITPNDWKYQRYNYNYTTNQERQIENIYNNFFNNTGIPEIATRTLNVVQTKNRMRSNQEQQTQNNQANRTDTQNRRTMNRQNRTSRNRGGY